MTSTLLKVIFIFYTTVLEIVNKDLTVVNLSTVFHSPYWIDVLLG